MIRSLVKRERRRTRGNRRNPLGLAGEVVRLANRQCPLGLASNKGFQPQNKPPVLTGGFD